MNSGVNGAAIGLSQSEALRKLEEYGENRLPQPEPPGVLAIFARQYKSPFIYVLLVAALVSLLLGQQINAVFIFAVLFLNAFIGTFQEYAAQRAATGLEEMVPHLATVLRDGRAVEIDTSQIVPGDVFSLESGDKVPADANLLLTHSLEVDESMLTGESVGVVKATGAQDAAKLFAGTTVLRGRGQAEVTATGKATELGKIATEVAARDQVLPPLMQRIEAFTMRVTVSMLILIAAIFLITLMRGDDVTSVFFLGVALAVSAIPEGLPVAITVALAIGMQRMAKRGVIIRNLVAVESLGSCTFIASDKTGTLTVNEMTARKIVLANGATYAVSGEGLNVSGQITLEQGVGDSETLDRLIHAGMLSNESTLEVKAGIAEGVGDSVDLAFLILGLKHGLDPDMRVSVERASIPYESENAYSASIDEMPHGIELFVKGSFEQIAAMSRPSDSLEQLRVAVEEIASEGYRVLALAHRQLESVPDDPESALVDLEPLGIVAMIDPLRSEVIEAVKDCRDASIRVAMVTGDHPATASVLAGELGLGRFGITRRQDRVVTGAELAAAAEQGDDSFDSLVDGTRVFARVAPDQKMTIVDSLINKGEFVAVTGDGINDAPALKHAHLGIAMGKRGCDVARESADMILTDDNFASIVHGVREGRVVYNNIRKVIFLLISTGAAEITLIMLSILFGMPLPLLPLQLLWLNLVTNGIQDVALVFEPEEGDELKRPPRSPDEPIFDRLMIERVVVNAVFMGCLAFAVFYYQMASGADETSARNMTLLLMVLFENVHVFNSRSERLSIFKQSFFSNPFLLFGMLAAQGIHILAMHSTLLGGVLEISPVSFSDWGGLLSIALLLVLIDETHKAWLERQQRKAMSIET